MRILLTGLLAGFSTALLSACQFSAPSSQADACDRACAIGLAKKVSADPALFQNLIRLTENGADTTPAESWLTGAANLDFHGGFAEEEAGQAIIYGTGVGRDGKPAVFGLRIDLSGEAIVNAELITARDGEASLFPPATPIKRLAIFDETVPEAQRSTRETLIALANAYFDGIETDVANGLPVTETCERIENGVQTTHSPRFSDLACNSFEPFVYITEVPERRYPVVDVERGVVVAAAAFRIPGGEYVRVINGQETTRRYEPRALFLFESFKVVDGKIEMIEATMRNMPLDSKMGW